VHDILIVDDSRAMRNFLRKGLAMTALQIGTVHEAANGQEALALLETVSVHLIFSDINMPIMDGVAFVQELQRRDLTKQIPVLVVSTDSSSERVRQILALGARGYIPKPFSPELLEREVMRLLETDPEWVEPQIA
jgi:two-component system chemotaxis response regulator CheY